MSLHNKTGSFAISYRFQPKLSAYAKQLSQFLKWFLRFFSFVFEYEGLDLEKKISELDVFDTIPVTPVVIFLVVCNSEFFWRDIIYTYLQI